MSITILGENIDLIRPKLVPRPKPAQAWRIKYDTRPRTKKLTPESFQTLKDQLEKALKKGGDR